MKHGVYTLICVGHAWLSADLSVCLDVNCGEAGCIAVNGSAICLCIDTEPWTPPDHRMRCNYTLTGEIVSHPLHDPGININSIISLK